MSYILCCLALGSFVDCLNGPNVPVSLPACKAYDLDGDEDVDIQDFMYFQNTGETMSDIYIDVINGNDSTGLGTVGSPWKTMSKALTTLPSGAGPHNVYVVPSATSYTGTVALGSSINGKTVTVKPTVVGGANGVIWDHSGGTTAQITLGSSANSFTLTFEDMTILRSNASGNTYTILTSNASLTTASFNFLRCEIDSHKHLFLHNNAGTVSLSFTDCEIRYGSSFIFVNTNRTIDSISINNCTVSPSDYNAGVQGGVFNFQGPVSSLEINESDFIQGGNAAGATLLDIGVRVTDLTVTNTDWHVRNGYVQLSAPINAGSQNSLTITGCRFLDEIGDGAPGYTGAYGFVSLIGGPIVFNNNEIVWGTATNASINGRTLILSNLTDSLECNGNTITTGVGAIYATLGGDGGTGSFSSNQIYLTNVNSSNGAAAFTMGQDIDEGTPTYAPGAFLFNDNYIECTGSNHGALMYILRDVRGIGSEIARNTLISHGSSTTSYGIYCKGANLHIHHNKIHCRASWTPVGAQGCTIEYNSCYSIDQGAKAVWTMTAHSETYHHEDNIHRNNIFVIGAGEYLSGGYIVSDTDNYMGMENCLMDYNWYAAETGVPLGYINNTACADLAALQAQWNNIDANVATYSGVAGNDAHSVYSNSPEIFVNPANGDFSLNALGLSLLCGADFTAGATDYNCSTGSGITSSAVIHSRATRLTISPVTSSTRTQWQVVGNGGTATYQTTTSGESSGSPNVLGAALSHLDLWLPPFHSFVVRIRSFVDGAWTEWSSPVTFQSRGPLNSYENFYALSRNTITIGDNYTTPPDVDDTPVIDVVD